MDLWAYFTCCFMFGILAGALTCAIAFKHALEHYENDDI